MRKLLVSVIILFFTLYLRGQDEFLQFKQITTDNGLSNSQVVSLLQDYRGFMWIGTYSGLNRYDGKNIVIYKNIPFDSTSIAGNVAKAIFEDTQKRLFIGTFEGLSLYNRNSDCFLNYSLDTTSVLYGMILHIFRITGDTAGNLWLATSSGLVFFDIDNNKMIHYKHSANDPSTLSDDFLEDVYLDTQGRLWISSHKGLDLMDTKTKKIEHITKCLTHKNVLKNAYHSSAIEDRDGNIWFGSYDGLFCLENTQWNSKPELIHYQNDPNNANSLSHNYVLSLFIDDANNLWLGTENGGINLFNKDKKTFSHYRIDDFNPKSLNNESVWAITQDKNKNFWVGTFGGGVNISIKNSDFIVHFKNLPGADKSIGHNIVKAFLEDESGKKWIATDGGGLNQFDDRTGHFVRYNTANSNLSSNAILCLEHGDENQIWLGTWAGGLVNYNSRTNSFTAYTTINSNISDDNIHALAKDNNGNLWLGTQLGGLVNYIVKENKFVTYSPENSNIISQRVSTIKIDNKGQIYIGATNGLQIFNPMENQFYTFVNSSSDSNSLCNNYIIDIFIVNDTCVWVTTSNGLNRFNPVTKKFIRYFIKDGLPDNSVMGVTADKLGMLWLSTSNGICRFDYRTNSFKNFSKSDGLQGNEFNDRSILALKNGKILIGGKNGFNVISPNKIPENSLVPDVRITGFDIFNQAVIVGAKNSPLSKQISETNTIKLTYKQSVLTFYFAVLDFTNPLKNQYAYMMEGFDKNWIYCGNRSDATYTNLNPGNYVFRVKGSNNDGVWNEKGTSIKIIITPPWWKTQVAIFSFIILIIGLFFSFYFFRINELRKQKKLLGKLVKERTNELYESNTQLKEINEEVNQQKEELITQAEILASTNKKLEKSTEELENHKNNLEELIKIRTTELEKSKEKAEESDRLKSAFLANMSHEIRTPMNAIVGFSNLLNQPDLTDDIKGNYVSQITSNSGSLLTLIDDILDISMMESNLLAISKKEFELNLLLDEVFLDGSIQNPQSVIRLNNHVEELKLVIETDRFRLKQILVNLFNNACKFTEKGYIELGCFIKDRDLFLYVKDTGIGISHDNLEIIFDRFSKVTDEKTKLFRGVGLGLAISKKIAELLGGELTGESELGAGSTFSLVLPSNLIVKSKVVKQNVVQINPLNWEHKKILIVEDEEANYFYMESALRPTKAIIVWAQNGSVAVELFKTTEKFDVILMDIKMPVMNGYDATVAIKAIFPNQIIIAQTAYARAEEYTEIKKAGFNDYLVKPIVPIDLYNVLSKYL